MIRSKTLERISNNEIGRKSLLVKGISVFGIGHILATYLRTYDPGKMECSMESLVTLLKRC